MCLGFPGVDCRDKVLDWLCYCLFNWKKFILKAGHTVHSVHNNKEVWMN